MTIRELYKKIVDHSLTEEERDLILRKFVKETLCPVSQASIIGFQDKHHNEITLEGVAPDYDRFCKEQDKEIALCIDLEMSIMGVEVRKVLKLPSLNWETEL